MMRQKPSIFLLNLALLLIASQAQARPNKPWKDWYGHVSGGYALTVGDVNDIADDGWNLSGGATYWPEKWQVGIMMELGYNDFDIKKEAIEGIAPKGDAQIWTLSVGAIWATHTAPVDFYLTANVGWNRLEAALKEPSYAVVPPACSPWWWWCYPGGVVPADRILDSWTTNKIGYDAGLGLGFTLPSDTQLFLEARYHWMNTSTETTWIPINFGVRW